MTQGQHRAKLEIIQAEGVRASHLAKNHLMALDGLRGLAVLMVMVFHYRQHMVPFGPSWLSIPLRFLYAGQSGVDLFFVLSGFLITGILVDAKGSPHALRNFYMRRVLRILPLYYLVVVGCLLYGWFASNPWYSLGRGWWYIFYLQNIATTFWPGSVGEPGHFWSLGVEEHFYLVWPFLILTFGEKRLPAILLSLIGGAIVCRFLLLTAGYDVFTFSLCRMDALALGALLAVLLRRRKLAEATGRACRFGLIISSPLLLALYLLTSGSAFFIMQVMKYTMVALGYTFLIGAMVGPNKAAWLERLFKNGFLRWCGKYSYAMYVFHPFVYGLLMELLRSRMGWSNSSPVAFMAIEFPILFVAVCLVSWLSWQLFEKRFLKLKSHFEYSVAQP